MGRLNTIRTESKISEKSKPVSQSEARGSRRTSNHHIQVQKAHNRKKRNALIPKKSTKCSTKPNYSSEQALHLKETRLGLTDSLPSEPSFENLLVELRSPLLLTAPSICGRLVRWSGCGSQLRSCHMPYPCRDPAFLSTRCNSPEDAAYASSPVIDTLTTRNKKIRRLWLQGERAHRKPPDKFAAIDCNLHSISALLLPLKAYRPPRCLALHRISPKRINAVGRLLLTMSVCTDPVLA